jgi:hypothetical protein
MATLTINKEHQVSVKAIKKEVTELGLTLTDGVLSNDNGRIEILATPFWDAAQVDIMLVALPNDGRMLVERMAAPLAKAKFENPEVVEAWFNNFLVAASDLLADYEEETEEEEEEEEEIEVPAKKAPAKKAAAKKAEPEPEEEEDGDDDEDGDEDEDWDDEEESDDDEVDPIEVLKELGLKIADKMEEDQIDLLYQFTEDFAVASMSGKATKAAFTIVIEGDKKFTTKAVKALDEIGTTEWDKAENTITLTIER